MLQLTPKVWDRAAQLAVPGSVLAGPAAARCWDIPVRDGRTFLLVARHANPSLRRVGLLYDSVDRWDLTTRDGAPVTSPQRTIVDCLRIVPEPDALSLLDRALQQNWISLEELSERVRGLAGRRGTPRLVRLVKKVAGGSRSAAERLIARRLDDAGIAGWALNVAITDERGPIGVGDVVFKAAKVVIEVDGWAFHVTPGRFQRDRQRQNRLVAAGWTVLRFTWRDLTERPGYVVASIATVLNGRTDPPPS